MGRIFDRGSGGATRSTPVAGVSFRLLRRLRGGSEAVELVDVDAVKCCMYGRMWATRGLAVGSIVICMEIGKMFEKRKYTKNDEAARGNEENQHFEVRCGNK